MAELVYLDHTYQQLTRINLHTHDYLFTMHQGKLQYLEHSSGMTFRKVSKEDIKKSSDLTYQAEQFLLTAFRKDVERQMKNGEITSIEELMSTLKNFKSYVENNQQFRDLVDVSHQMDVTGKSFQQLVTDMLQQFESLGIDKTPLELDGLENVNANGKDYIKHENQDGSVHIVENNSQFSAKEQYEAKKEEMKDLSKENGQLNADTIFQDMEARKIGTKLEQESEINRSYLSHEEEERMKAVEKSVQQEKAHILYDPERNIFYNEKTQEVLTTEQKDGMIRVKRTEGTLYHTHDEEKITSVEFDQETKEAFREDCLKAEMVLEKLQESGTQNIGANQIASEIVNQKQTLSPEQKKEYQAKLASYIRMQMEKNRQMSAPQAQLGGYQYTLKQQPNRPTTSGYISSIVLGFLVGVALLSAPMVALLFQA